MGKIIVNDIFGKALIDFQNNNFTENITTYSSVAGKDMMELSWLFRTFHEMPLIEQTALQLCKGSILDIGCGAGSHTLFLQDKGFKIKAIDISEGAIKTCNLRGVENAFLQDIMQLKNEKFDTIIALMNGTGLCGKIDNLENLLKHLKSLLTHNGQILIDSSDIIYMFEDDFGDISIPENQNYYGEVVFEFKYKNEFSKKFDWLFIDFNNLCIHANNTGLHCELIQQGFHYEYLAKLTLNVSST
ncbi:class I SAM-dependent methyltransferase [Flavobacteriaceae bacterium AH-315-O20]|nr:class I SAM-dependent methyltransferase [Flavobacteriaceae bacterium AH-315-O20]